MSKEEKKMRIFINSNADWATSGYAMQLSELLEGWQKWRYPIGVCAFHGLEGGKLNINNRMYYPRINHLYGSDAMVLHARDFKADVVFSLQDIWVLHPEDLKQVNRFIPIVPIDHEPVPGAVLDKLKYAYRIVTYSKFGQQELERRGYKSTYIQHTVNTEIFKPNPKVKEDSNLFCHNKFVVGMVSANKENPPRKSFQECMDAFKLFLDKVPEALLYIHTNPDFPNGFPIKEYANFIGISDKLFFPEVYSMNFKLGKEQMANIYNMMDILLCPSINEGFGVPIIEAQACGVPVVTNNFTAMPELVRKGVTGEICDVLYKRFSPMGSYVGQPDHKSIFDCMMKIYSGDRAKMGVAAREFMLEEYDTEKIMATKWKPFLAKLEKEIYP